MDNLIGKRLDGRYLIQDLIGAGGMANVYKAADAKEQRTVAVKILREECMRNEELVRRFKNESKAISVLNHPNIVKVYDICVTEHMQYIVMEFIEGITLKEYMEYRKQPLTDKETLHFVSQTLMALQHAHEKGIVHRDIKPQNIMMLPNGNLKVMDFGIARFSRSENHTMTDKAIGSVHYISPEQAKGDLTDPKADIYSVGVMMYEMLAGRLPFDGDSAVNVAIKQISDTATPLRSINAAVPESLAAITERAMAKETRERYASASAMLADIAAFKRDPSVKFNYQYLGDTAPTRYLDKAVIRTAQKKQATPAARTGSRTPTKPSAGGAARRAPKKSMISLLPILAGMAAAFLVAALCICYFLFKDSPIFSKATDVPLPNFHGKTMAEIKSSEDFKTFKIVFDEEFNTDTSIVAGTVFDQTPKPPKNVKTGAHITLRVSKGVQKISLPSVIGKDKEAAITELKNAGFIVMVKQIIEPTVTIGNVVKITGPEGDMLKAGDVVDSNVTLLVYVSREQIIRESTVPDLTGLSKQDAVARLTQANLAVNWQDVASESPAGTVIGQNPAPNTPLRWNDIVTVQVSLGHQHSHVQTELVTPATCVHGGERVMTCSCGDSFRETLPINPEVHQFDPNNKLCLFGCGTQNTEYIEPVAPPPVSSTVPVSSTAPVASTD